MNAALDPARLSAAAPAPARALLPGAIVDGFEIVRVMADTDLGIEYLALDPRHTAEVLLFDLA